MAADGSIVIDTKLNTSGMNTGVKSLGNSLKGILNIVKGIGKTLVAAFVGGTIINSLRGLIGSFDFLKSSIGDKFKPLSDSLSVLKGTFINLIATAIVPLIPYIVMAVQWFTHLLSVITQLVGALFGVKKTMGGIATETDKTTKATKGALAAFDQINVLQQQQENPNGAQPFITPEAMDVPQSFLDKIDAIKKKILEIKDLILAWWNDPIGKLQETWGKIVAWFKANVLNPLAAWWKTTWIGDILSQLWENFKSTWGAILTNTFETSERIKARINQVLGGIAAFITGIFTGNWLLAWNGLRDIVLGVFGVIWEFIKGALTNILLYFDGWKKQILIIWNALPQPLKDAFNSVLNWIITTSSNLANWFRTNVTEPIKNAFNAALNGIRDGFVNVFTGILTFVGNIVKGIIDRIQGMINVISSIGNFLNFQPPTLYNAPIATYGSIGGGYKPPHLATGAVIPPNSRFAAILGDQRSGMNLEAPAAMLQDMVDQAVARGGGSQEITIKFEGDLGALVRELKPVIEQENTRTGGKLK